MATCSVWTFNAKRAHELDSYQLGNIEKIISTTGWATHTEFRFSERYRARSFSATMAEGLNCCRWKDIDYEKHPLRWDGLMIDLTDAEEDMAFWTASAIEGQPYSVKALLSFASDWEVIKPKKGEWWCTRVAAHLIKAGKGGKFLRLPEVKYYPTLLDAELRLRCRGVL